MLIFHYLIVHPAEPLRTLSNSTDNLEVAAAAAAEWCTFTSCYRRCTWLYIGWRWLVDYYRLEHMVRGMFANQQSNATKCMAQPWQRNRATHTLLLFAKYLKLRFWTSHWGDFRSNVNALSLARWKALWQYNRNNFEVGAFWRGWVILCTAAKCLLERCVSRQHFCTIR